jgi:hypothetical protein
MKHNPVLWTTVGTAVLGVCAVLSFQAAPSHGQPDVGAALVSALDSHGTPDTWSVINVALVGWPWPPPGTGTGDNPERKRAVLRVNRVSGQTFWLDKTNDPRRMIWVPVENSPNTANGRWTVKTHKIEDWPFPATMKQMVILIDGASGQSYWFDKSTTNYQWVLIP